LKILSLGTILSTVVLLSFDILVNWLMRAYCIYMLFML
jgi:hypothetical protein